MACSAIGLVSIICAILGMTFSWLSFGLPLWSANGGLLNRASRVAKAQFSAGVWGVCTGIEIKHNKQNSSINVDKCHLYYTSQKAVDYVNATADNHTALEAIDIDESLCGRWTAVNQTQLPVNLPLTPEFLDATCGKLGKATLVMAVFAPSFGTLVTIFLLLGVTCCKKKSFVIRLGAVSAMLSCIFTSITIALWVKQSKSLHHEHHNTRFSVSFFMAIAACVFFFAAKITALKHAAKGDAVNALDTSKA